MSSSLSYTEALISCLQVVRTRLRQPHVNGVLKYQSLVQTFRLVVAEEGVSALYGGLSAHLLRVIPNAIVMYSIYELVIGWSGKKQSESAP
jgi:solute carrier family 25 protein 33/36